MCGKRSVTIEKDDWYIYIYNDECKMGGKGEGRRSLPRDEGGEGCDE
jgi:hypothetical protein